MSESIRVFALLHDAGLRRQLQQQWPSKGITLCGTHAEGGNALVEEVARLKPEVVIVDADMDGAREVIEGVAQRCRIPVIALVRAKQSATAIVRPLEWGAVHLVQHDALTVEQLMDDLEAAIEVTRSAQVVELLHGSFPLSGAFPSSEVFDMRRALQVVDPKDKVVVISAGVGGPMAMRRILSELKQDIVSPIVFVQQLAPALLDAVATWLAQNSSFTVERVADGRHLEVGHVYVVASNVESVRIDSGAQSTLRVAPEPVAATRPVDSLLENIVSVYGSRTVAVLLSGRGEDGCNGLQVVRDAGGFTMVQDRASSLIYDMPCRAREAGGAIECLPINEIADRIQMLMRLDHASSS